MRERDALVFIALKMVQMGRKKETINNVFNLSLPSKVIFVNLEGSIIEKNNLFTNYLFVRFNTIVIFAEEKIILMRSIKYYNLMQPIPH